MPEASFPSDAFPALPAVTIDLPEGWKPRAVPGTFLAAIDDRGSAFSPNVVLGITRVGAGHTLEAAAAAVAQHIESLPEVAPVDSARVDFGGAEWWVTEFAYSTDAAGTVAQVVAVSVVDHGDVVDVLRLTGTATPADYETSLPQIRGIVSSVRLG
ncbi:hypothetical protein AB1K54_13075 [Microbacterium sp. BWT-B31]|uniref:hypothetical protein n=1 Tax=Microbacterium sp. BWT-B31 TaxID=3232072 RepID=UPI0035296A1A